jgi:hypothetical protein
VGDGLTLPLIQAIKDPTRHARTTIAGCSAIQFDSARRGHQPAHRIPRPGPRPDVLLGTRPTSLSVPDICSSLWSARARMLDIEGLPPKGSSDVMPLPPIFAGAEIARLCQ